MSYNNIAKKIREIREGLNLSQRELAKRMEVPQSTVVRIESGEMNVSAATLDKFCKATGYALEFISTGDQESLVYEVCDYILDFCKRQMGQDFDVTNMKLNKLLFLVYKEYRNKFSTLFFENNFRAWEHGPVYLGVYHKYRDYKNEVIKTGDSYYGSLNQEQINLIQNVLQSDDNYIKSAYQLRRETHEDKLWIEARKKGENELIAFL
jgi:uncharacterized phage-associated protein/DNA-binding Xre family transcriptional regulator